MIDAVNEDEVGGSKSDGNEKNPSNLSTSKKSTGAGYLTSNGTKKDGNNPKRGGGNIKKGIKVAKSSNYLIPSTKKTFNLLQHAFI